MRVLLTEGSGLTARQAATRLDAAGHTVEALSSDPLALCRFTRHVRRLRKVPPYGADPFAWLEAALAHYQDGGFDLLLPTQEQVAVLAAAPRRLASEGVRTVVPEFGALARVQDKRSAVATLAELGLPQPPFALDPDGWDRFPAFVKDPIGTASGGVRRVGSPAELATALAGRPPAVVQQAVDGPLAMVQTVFDHGTLVAFHACRREREGANGGASHKRSLDLPDGRDALATLGSALGWHGALSADVIVTGTGPSFIDLNPRLVEPENAWRAGVDLVGALVDLAGGGRPAPQAGGASGVATHQLLLAVLGAAQHGGGRRGVAAELVAAWRRSGSYRGSAEELTPTRGDRRAAVPVVAAALATLVRPATWSAFADGSVANYALTPGGWDRVRDSVGVSPRW
jgi:hypothetical protein